MSEMDYKNDESMSELCFAVNIFLSKLGIMHRMATAPMLVLHVPTIRMMHELQVEIIRGLPRYMQNVSWDYPDDYTVVFSPMAGVEIALITTERLSHEGQSVPTESIQSETNNRAQENTATTIYPKQWQPPSSDD